MIDDNYFIAGTNRDTHFSGFAKLQLEKLKPDLTALYVALTRGTGEEIESAESIITTLIAQCAYDFALYIMKDAPVTEWEWDMRDIKDLIEWPQE